jgi:hypothetical protein
MPIMRYGTLQLIDTLRQIDKDNVFTYGEDLFYEQVRALLDAHNQMTRDMLGLMAETTTSYVDRYGTSSVEGDMVEVDEFGAADVQKQPLAGYDIGYPLRLYQYNLGWTRKYLETRSVADLTAQIVAAQTADVKNLRRQAAIALFRATNATFIDRLMTNQTLPIKALQNADGTAIPVGPFGDTFDGATHTHLVGRAGGTLAASDITALVNNVVEHGTGGGEVVLLINRNQEATIRTFTANFVPLQAPLIEPGPGSTADIADGGRRANPYQIDDKIIGIWDGFVRVWVKPWIPNNYMVALLLGGSAMPVLKLRRRPLEGYGDLRMVAEHEHYPLRARFMEREFGIGVWGRLSAAILYTAGTSYVAPAL